MTTTAETTAARVVTLPVRERAGGPVAVSDVLAQVLPLAAFRRPARTQPLPMELARRCAALAAIGAWRRAHPDAPFEQDLATAERINLEFGVR
ncbi:hypothetical protein [Roseateles puraquae]|uniref:hypothetical protein n=1 Tax=Roseateles puraquae TaxID=431059 RepID=UPI0031D9C77A